MQSVEVEEEEERAHVAQERASDSWPILVTG